MTMLSKLSFVVALAALSSWAYCTFGGDEPPDDNDGSVGDTAFEFDFAEGDEGFGFGFADYPAGDEDAMGLRYARAAIPDECGPGHGLLISGRNLTDDLFMFVKKQIAGLAPSTTYDVTFQLEMASNAPHGSIGIGGSPAHSVCVKAGATIVEPMAAPDSSGFMLMNIDKGNQLQSGTNMVALGDFAKPSQDASYELITRDNLDAPFQFTSDETGVAWIVVGFDSGFEGTTTAYLSTIRVAFVPALR